MSILQPHGALTSNDLYDVCIDCADMLRCCCLTLLGNPGAGLAGAPNGAGKQPCIDGPRKLDSEESGAGTPAVWRHLFSADAGPASWRWRRECLVVFVLPHGMVTSAPLNRCFPSAAVLAWRATRAARALAKIGARHLQRHGLTGPEVPARLRRSAALCAPAVRAQRREVGLCDAKQLPRTPHIGLRPDNSPP